MICFKDFLWYLWGIIPKSSNSQMHFFCSKKSPSKPPPIYFFLYIWARLLSYIHVKFRFTLKPVPSWKDWASIQYYFQVSALCKFKIGNSSLFSQVITITKYLPQSSYKGKQKEEYIFCSFFHGCTTFLAFSPKQESTNFLWGTLLPVCATHCFANCCFLHFPFVKSSLYSFYFSSVSQQTAGHFFWYCIPSSPVRM